MLSTVFTYLMGILIALPVWILVGLLGVLVFKLFSQWMLEPDSGPRITLQGKSPDKELKG